MEIDKKLVEKLVEEIKESDQKYLDQNYFNKLKQQEQAAIYFSLGQMHAKEAKSLYGEAFQVCEMLEKVNPIGAEELSCQVGYLGMAHQFIGREYAIEARRLGKLEKIL